MTRLSKIIGAQGDFLLENYWHALLCVIIFSVLPYTTWLASVLIALVTLRKGGRASSFLLILVITAHFFCSVVYVPASVAAAQTFLSFIPCFVAAYILRITKSWRAVAATFFIFAMTMVLFVQILVPSVILAQYQMFKSILMELNAESNLLQLLGDDHGINPLIVANFLLGIQTAGLVFSSLFSLMIARWVQSLAYYPGGFSQEMRNFRADKIGLLFLSMLLIAAYFEIMIAVNLLPLVMFYFFLAGLSLGYNLLAQKKPLGTFLLLITPVILLPYVMMPLYLVFGSLDSLFNFRVYLAKHAGK